MVINKKFNLSVILSYIGIGLFLISVIISFALFAPHSSFINLFNEILTMEATPGITFEQYLQTNNINPSDVLALLYIIFTICNVLALIIGVASLIFTSLVFKDSKKGIKEFRKNRGLQITYIVFLGITVLSIFSNVSQVFSLLVPITPIILIISFVMAIFGINDNSRKLKIVQYYNEKKAHDLKMNATINPFYTTSNVNENEVIDVIDDNKEVKEEANMEEIKEEVVENQKEEVNETLSAPQEEVNINFDEMYQKLADLEKAYQKGKISDQDYIDKKHDILEEYKF